MLLRAHEVMTPDGPLKYLSRHYVKVHTHGRRGFKVRLPLEDFDSIATAMEIVGCGARPVFGSDRSLKVQSRSWTTAVHDQGSAGGSPRSEESVEATGKAVRVGHARLAAVCAIHVGTRRRVGVPDSARQISKDRRGGYDRSLH